MALVRSNLAAVDSNTSLFEWEIKGFSRLDRVLSTTNDGRFHSGTFDSFGYKWKLTVELESRRLLSVYLHLENAFSLPSRSMVRASFVLYVHNHKETINDIEQEVTYDFKRGKNIAGFEHVISSSSAADHLEDVSSSGQSSFMDDCIVVGVEMTSVCLLRKRIESFTLLKEDAKKHEFTWVIKDFSKLTFRYYDSERSTSWGHTWHLSLFPKGRYLDTHISLFLELENPASGPVLVEFTLTILDQVKGRHQQNTTLHMFSHEDQSLGWVAFMTLVNLKDPSKGFLVDDTCIVAAKIHVLGYTKRED